LKSLLSGCFVVTFDSFKVVATNKTSIWTISGRPASKNNFRLDSFKFLDPIPRR